MRRPLRPRLHVPGRQAQRDDRDDALHGRCLLPFWKHCANAVPGRDIWVRPRACNACLLGPLQHRALLPRGLDKLVGASVPSRQIRLVARPRHSRLLRRVRAWLLVPRGLDKRDRRCVPAGHLRLELGPADACLQRTLFACLLLPGQLDEPRDAAVPRGHLRRDQRPRHAAVQRAVRGRLVLPSRLKLADCRCLSRGRVLRTRQRGADRLPTGCLRRLRQPRDAALQRPLSGRRVRRSCGPADLCVLKPVRPRHLLRARLHCGPALRPWNLCERAQRTLVR